MVFPDKMGQTAQFNNLLYSLLASLLCLFTACGATVTPPPVFIKIAGSTSMQPLLAKLTAAYSAQHPYVHFDLQRGGSRLGQTLVETGEVDMGLISDPAAKPADTLRLTPVARDAVAIIVNPQNRLGGLSPQDARDIFRGRLLNWQEVDGPAGPIQVVSREDGAGTRAVFEAAVMENGDVTPTARVMPSNQAVLDFVAQNPNAIGYVSSALLDDRVVAVPIEGVSPTLANIAAGSYFLTRNLSLLTPAQGQPEVDRFIEFALSPAGQKIVGENWAKVR